jgi:glyoxylase-like metal-dependent hydrolase (beta-lactamase superfamily II)
MTGSGTNTYLIGTTDLVAIDPGPEDTAHLDRLVDLAAGRLRYILVTHRHLDHAPLARRLADATGAPVLGYGFGEEFRPDAPLRPGDTVAVPGFAISVVHTPGHASDHLCFLGDRTAGDPSDRICFTGDHLMGGSSVVIAPPDGAMTPYLESITALLELDRPISVIAPGHGELLTDPDRALRHARDHRLERERLVRAALSEVPRSVSELVPAVYRGLDPRLARAAGRTLWAHLRRLSELGVATSDDPDDPDGSWRALTVGSG